MTYPEQIASAIQVEIDSDEIDKERLTKNLLVILARQKQVVDDAAAKFNALFGDESALTIPLSDGCVVKVKFSGPATKAHLDAFSKIFHNIADNYVVAGAELQTKEQQ